MGEQPRRPDQSFDPPPSSLAPGGRAGVLRANKVIIFGPGGGEFVYNATATHLESSNVGAATTDPILGISCPQGFATYNTHGKVINLLSTANNAFFQYADLGTSSQGPLILSVASVAGTDPVDSTTYVAGFTGTDAFGNFTEVVGSGIAFSTTAMTRAAGSQVLNAATSANSPTFKVDGPEQTTANHLSMQLLGASPDGTTRAPQILVSHAAGNTIPAPVTTYFEELQPSTSQPGVMVLPSSTGVGVIATQQSGDTNTRWTVLGDGSIFWGPGNAGADVELSRLSAARMAVSFSDLAVHTAGKGLQVAEGSNAKQGTATLVGGTVVVANTSVTASSKIFVGQNVPHGTPGACFVSAVTAGTGFTIKSTSATDTSVVGYEIFEPG